MKRLIPVGFAAAALAASIGGCAASGSSATTTSSATRPHKSHKHHRPNFAGLGGTKRAFLAGNPHLAPPNLAGAPAGLTWYTVDATNAAGRVTAFHATENAKPAMGDADRLSLVAGILLPGPPAQVVHQTATCVVYRDGALKRLIGMEYAAATTTTDTTTAYIQAESGPVCP
jgi:hypothetical protein